MLNEAPKLGIAMDLIEYKIAEKMVERRTNENKELLPKIEKELKELLQEKKEIYAGNIERINNIIEERKLN